MLTKFQYSTVEEREQILQENSSSYHIEEQNLFEGNFLIFSDEPRPIEPIYVDVSKTELAKIQEQVNELTLTLGDALLGGGL